ncbi:MAG: hypothetical protein JW820_01450 [Spirochaetales bacterium]|nr:hypothetical protein [Spirochaetales bacterium]
MRRHTPAAPGLFLLFLLLLPGGAMAQAEASASADWYYDRARAAIEAENYTTAVELLQEGQRLYPAAGALNALLADLYYEKELFSLALGEYLEAERKDGADQLTLSQIARCYGKLNREPEAILTLERSLELYPDSVYTVDDLGWMYFKTHQLEKGEALLLDALERFGPERGLYMTLGTIYSGMYDYDSSRRYYLAAIEDALNDEDHYFASVAYYNLSLLEHSFYRFNSALRHTDESIRLSDRAPGHLARGELFQSRLEFRRALEEYELARARDTTPLSKVNLAMLYQRFGHLELGRRYAEEVLRSRERAWMYYFGTDVPQHLKDVHEILWKAYAGLARVGARRPVRGPLERLGLLLASSRQRVLAYYHRQKFRSYCLEIGRSYREESNLLDAYWELYQAGQDYPQVALKYLGQAREIEVPISPGAAPYYLLEEGRLRGERALLEEAIDGFDPFWEREAIHEALVALVPLLPTGSAESRAALNRLFLLNPGALLQNGLRLPLAVELPGASATGGSETAGAGRRERRELRRVVRRLGSSVRLSSETVEQGIRFSLSLAWEGRGLVRMGLIDRNTGQTLFGETLVAERPLRGRAAADLAGRIVEHLYSAR